MSKLFISHATSDRKFVEDELKGLLAALGFQVWFAEEDIKTAEHFERAILNGLQTSEWFVLIMSPRSSKSEWVKDEISWAIEEMPGRIIPIMLEDCNPRDFHIRLPRIQYIDFRNNKKDACERLIRLLVDAEYKPYLRNVNMNDPLLKKSRNFWNPFSDDKLQIVVGRFLEFRSFEQSGFLGVGDAIAMTELRKHLELIGMQDVTIAYADRLDGDGLKTHLVLLGGPDNNTITKEAVSRIQSKIRFGDPDNYEISIYDSESKERYVPIGTGSNIVKNDYGVIFKTANPFAPDKQLLLVAGSFGFGTWAGVRFILSEKFLNHNLVAEHPSIECLVEADIFRETPQNIKLIVLRELAPPA
jgi:hypothetical protein